MSDNSKISWTDATWNPLYGCSRVSAGCVNCYAEQVVASLPRKFKEKNPAAYEFYSGLTKETPQGPRWTGVVKVHEEHLLQPLKWKEPRRIFVNSLSDLFHESLSFDRIAVIFGVMAAASWHTFQVLTKRPERMLAFFKWMTESAKDSHETAFLTNRAEAFFGVATDFNLDTESKLSKQLNSVYFQPWPLPNVWIGCTVENQEAADKRIPLLLQTPAAVRFLSCEPLLGPLDLSHWLDPEGPECDDIPCAECGNVALTEEDQCECYYECGPVQIDWIIAGGESGSNHRPMDPAWALSLKEQCSQSKVAFFFKQQSAVRAGQRPWLEEKGKRYRWHQFPGQLTKPELIEG